MNLACARTINHVIPQIKIHKKSKDQSKVENYKQMHAVL